MALTALSGGATEGDVEAQIVLPILTRAEYLGISLEQIKSKEFLAAFDIGKGAKTKRGYVPDFCVYALSLPILVIEVKAAAVPVLLLGTKHRFTLTSLTSSFQQKLIHVTNGLEFGAGRWDSARAMFGFPKSSRLIRSPASFSPTTPALACDTPSWPRSRTVWLAAACIQTLSLCEPASQ